MIQTSLLVIIVHQWDFRKTTTEQTKSSRRRIDSFASRCPEDWFAIPSLQGLVYLIGLRWNQSCPEPSRRFVFYSFPRAISYGCSKCSRPPMKKRSMGEVWGKSVADTRAVW